MKQLKEKITLYLDADDTILRSSEAAIQIINKRFNINPPKTINDLHDWGYRSIYKNITAEDVTALYESDEFFNMVEFDQSFLNFYKQHKDKVEIVVVTKGTDVNLEKKEVLIKKVLGKSVQFVGLKFKYDVDGNVVREYNKKTVNMRHGIQIDDRTDSLRDTNANIKILINNDRVQTWNQHYENINNLYVTRNWDEIAQIILFAYDNHFIFKKS